MHIHNRLAELRKQAGKTQDQVIEELTTLVGDRPFTRQMLSHYETGRHHLTGHELALMCRYYGVTPGDILTLVQDPAPLVGASA